MKRCCFSVDRLTEVIDKVKKDILLKGSSQVVVPKANLSGQVEALIKATFGRCCNFMGRLIVQDLNFKS